MPSQPRFHMISLVLTVAGAAEVSGLLLRVVPANRLSEGAPSLPNPGEKRTHSLTSPALTDLASHRSRKCHEGCCLEWMEPGIASGSAMRVAVWSGWSQASLPEARGPAGRGCGCHVEAERGGGPGPGGGAAANAGTV